MLTELQFHLQGKKQFILFYHHGTLKVLKYILEI